MLGILSRHRRREKSWRDASDETNRLWREGLALEQKEEYEEAVTAFQTCTANYEKELGPNQAQTAWSHSHLASACANISRLTQAELHWTKCEAAQAKIFGPMHTHTLQTSANLFQVFARQGKWKEAKQKGKSVLAALEKTEGPNHLSTLKTTLLLGEVYVYFCRYDTALTLHQRAFSGLESTFGPGSSETIWAQYKLANLYDEMGKTTECGKILKQHREICRTTLGVDSEPYMRATWELGRNHRVQGNLVEAETTLTPMLLGSGTNSAHPREKKYLLNSATELVKVYKALGRTAEAREVEKWANGELDVFPKAGDVKTNQDETTSSLPRMGDDEEVFHWDVKIVAADGNFSLATALLDTQCQRGNWVSLRLVKRLGKASSISPDFTAPGIGDASGHSITAIGIIELDWKRHPRGNRVHTGKFYVFPASDQFDVLFGVQYIVQEKLLLVNDDAMAPLLEHKKLNNTDKAAIALAEERQRQEKAALEARRQAAHQGSASQQDQIEQQQGQQS